MRSVPVALVLAALLAPASLAADGDVEVRLDLTLAHHGLPSYRSCTVSVPAGSGAGDVLDAATAAGCIGGWTFDRFGSERFVTCIDGLCQQLGTFWAFYVDEALPCDGSCGIDADSPEVRFDGGEVVEFAYVDWFTPFPPFSDLLP